MLLNVSFLPPWVESLARLFKFQPLCRSNVFGQYQLWGCTLFNRACEASNLHAITTIFHTNGCIYIIFHNIGCICIFFAIILNVFMYFANGQYQTSQGSTPISRICKASNFQPNAPNVGLPSINLGPTVFLHYQTTKAEHILLCCVVSFFKKWKAFSIIKVMKNKNGLFPSGPPQDPISSVLLSHFIHISSWSCGLAMLACSKGPA